MILIEFHNRIVEETLKSRFYATKPESCDITVADFDGVLFHISTDSDNKAVIRVSISIKCFAELQKQGVDDLLKSTYGSAMVAPESGYDVTLSYDTTSVSDKAKAIKDASLLKRHCFAAPFVRMIELQEKGGSDEQAVIHYRDDESMYLQAHKDRVTCVFSVLFRDEDDIIIGKVFLQEFVDARRNQQQAPQVLFYHKEPPKELAGTDAKTGDNIGYVTFVLFPRHFRPEVRERSLSLIPTFRDYLHYHIKCAKAYLHSRMRARVALLLKILNRARPESTSTEKKTASGRTFTRR